MLTVCFLIVLGVAVVLGLLLDMIDAGSGLAELDDSVAEWGAEHATSAAVDVLEVITHLGGTPVVIAALVGGAVVDYPQRRNAEVFAFVAAVGIGQLVINNLLKLLIDRDRPDVMQLVETSGSSFPSGHSTAAAAAWSAVALVLGRDRGRVTQAWLAAGAGRHRRRRRHQPGAPRRALAHRRGRWACARVGLVPARGHRVRWPRPAPRRSGDVRSREGVVAGGVSQPWSRRRASATAAAR